jgi:hypothetical protein
MKFETAVVALGIVVGWLQVAESIVAHSDEVVYQTYFDDVVETGCIVGRSGPYID